MFTSMSRRMPMFMSRLISMPTPLEIYAAQALHAGVDEIAMCRNSC